METVNKPIETLSFDLEDHQLAVIIPAFKAEFLAKTLECLLQQTDQRFNLYVFDDASPEPIHEVLQKFQSRRPLTYYRFAENLGGYSLPRHWDRCVARTIEPWVWLFSDDDEMEPSCVESFRRELETTKGSFDLYRFNTCCINKDSKLVATNDSYPVEESGRDFLLIRLLEARGSTSQELVFSRQAWVKTGGFPDFPLAWAADDAFIAKMGKEKPIRLIPGPRIFWRLSGANITSLNSNLVLSKKIMASRLFIRWAEKFLDEENKWSGAEINVMTRKWFFRWLFYMRNRLSLRTCSEVDAFVSEMWQYPRGYGWIKCVSWNCLMIIETVRRRTYALLNYGRK